MRCNSCNVEIKAKENFVMFSCPKCGKTTIVRCKSCKADGRKYVCGECGFTGP
jgi:Zn-ribbon RNA-binding protein